MLTPLEFAERILFLRDSIDFSVPSFSVSSWGRTDTHNAAVGGVAKSAHRRWLGIDIIPDDPSPATLTMLQAAAARLDLEVIDEWATKGHYHLQPKGWAQIAW